MTKAFGHLVFTATPHLNDDRAVLDCVRQPTLSNATEDLACPGGPSSWLEVVADFLAPQVECGIAGMPRVNESAHLFVSLQEGVHFIYKKRGLIEFDCAIEAGRAGGACR